MSAATRRGFVRAVNTCRAAFLDSLFLCTVLLSTLLLPPGAAVEAATGNTSGLVKRPMSLAPRPTPAKPVRTTLKAHHSTEHMILKLAEHTDGRHRPGGITGTNFDAATLQAVFDQHGITPSMIRPLFDRPEQALDLEHQAGENRSRRELADLNLYFLLDIPAGTAPAPLADDLNALAFVELATPATLPPPVPTDIPPTTPDFSTTQTYGEDAPLGIGAWTAATTIPGADGDGVKLVDIEYQWVLDHEDLNLPASANIDTTATHADPFPGDEGSHGTAVLGMLGAGDNFYGMRGLVPAVGLYVSPSYTVEFGWNVARAVNNAAANLGAGDVILIEQQTCVCGFSCIGGQSGLGPVEWEQANYDAIANATALGITVVQAAGNGSVNLDSAVCQGKFDRTVRDSEAIIVGAGDSATRNRLGFSTYGSRVDVQGWGEDVGTLGYGGLFDPGDVRQRYTATFSGTSSASPMVAAAAVAVQGHREAEAQPPLDPLVLRSLLVSTGTPQPSSSQNIGPLPDIPAAIATVEGFCGDGILSFAEQCDGTEDQACPGECGAPGTAAACMCPTCGDGVRTGFSEECDGDDDDSCLNICGADCLCPDVDERVCYQTRFKQVFEENLMDDWETGIYNGKNAKLYCAPADTDGEDIRHPDQGNLMFKVRGDHTKRTELTVTNRFGTFLYDTKKTESAGPPTWFSHPGETPPQMIPFSIDGYRCVKVRSSRGAPKPPKITSVMVDDVFASRQIQIRQATTLCVPSVPVSIGTYWAPETYLMCYKAKSGDQTSVADLQVLTDPDVHLLDLRKEKELCVQSVVTENSTSRLGSRPSRQRPAGPPLRRSVP